ncbi:unnamed protein product [Diatraea saccharalis]|uniref:Cyclin-dependent kinase 2-interacting protein n=1 Tax=Diatraea saccharalis TaxID=40085 RepID=A0A9N9QZG7_9NEOP|nr:unnamed protein product [Diatraea saccharalis]
MSKTPDAVTHFNPRELSTPNKDFPGVSKTVFTHVSRLHELLNDWRKIKDKGVKLCRAISSLKLFECEDDYFPHQLKPIMESLVDALESLKDIVNGVTIIDGQLQALAKLQQTDEPVILTWTVKKISDTVGNISASIQKEYELKKVVTENVAHCRDEKLIDVYISSWELEPYFEPNAYLFAEIGLPTII